MLYALQSLLPVRFIPLPDELFTSWLVRLARENGTKLHTFSSLLFSEKRIWSRDLDKSADDRHLTVMVEKTGFAPELINETFLRSFTGKFYETHNPNGNSAWLMPVGIFHQVRRNYGLQICPACLREDGENSYYRKFWRISWVTLCEKHETILLDRCPNCESPIVFHRGEMGHRNLYSNYSNIQCSVCDFYWTEDEMINKTVPATPRMIHFQKHLKESVADGWIRINDEIIHTISFFNGLKQLIKLLSVSSRGRKFRETVSLKSRLPITDTAEEFNSFDFLPVQLRYQTLDLAGWLLSDWSNRFVEMAKESRTWSSTLLSYDKEVPFWYWLPIHDFLTRRTHYTTETEIFAALDYLKRNFDLLLPSYLEKFIGKPYLFEKRNGLFIASIYDQLRKHNDKKERERLKIVREQAKQVSANYSKTKSKKLYRNFKKKNSRPIRSFRRTQSMLTRLAIAHRRRSRLKMVKEMDKIQNTAIVAKRHGVTSSIVLKWYRRFQQTGLKGLDDHSRCPQTFRHQIVFECEENWIRQIHSEGLGLREIQFELIRRHDFLITEGGLYRVLKRLNLILPNSKKFPKKDKLPRSSVIQQKTRHYPHKKIHSKQEEWILDLHLEGFNNSQIKKALIKRYNFQLGVSTIRDTLLKNGRRSPRSRFFAIKKVRNFQTDHS